MAPGILTDFHLMRPLWLLAGIVGLLLFVALWRLRSRQGQWSRAIHPSLLPHLLEDGNKGGRRHVFLYFLLPAWLLASLAMAGPAWEKLPQPVQKKTDALVIIQDLSLSMYAQDLSPNRLTRAQHKIADILQARREGITALIVYSGDVHVVAPLTDDVRTITAMLPALSPGIMPSYGSNVRAAVERGVQLFTDTATAGGRLLLLTDEVTEDDVAAITRMLRNKGISLSVIGVGTREGGPIPKSEGGFWQDEQGTVIVPKMDNRLLRKLAADNRGRYRDIQLTDADIDGVLADHSALPSTEDFRQVEREFDQWRDQGVWLLLAILPLALCAFRRGWILGVFFMVLAGGGDCYAMEWQDLWLRADQQAARAMAADDPQEAAELFTDPAWKGSAAYRAGDFTGASEAFGQGDSAEAEYNRGNALVKMGKLPEALQAYEAALGKNPDMADAAHNQVLVKSLLEQQQEQQEKQEGDKSEEQQGDQGQDQQGEESGKNQESQKKDGQQGSPSDGEQQQDSGGSQDSQDQDGADSETARQEEAARQQESGEQDGQQEEEATAQDQKPLQTKAEEGPETEGQQGQAAMDSSLSDEEQQALQQWLRQVPDDPGGLLRRKFEYEYRRNQGRQAPRKGGKIW